MKNHNFIPGLFAVVVIAVTVLGSVREDSLTIRSLKEPESVEDSAWRAIRYDSIIRFPVFVPPHFDLIVSSKDPYDRSDPWHVYRYSGLDGKLQNALTLDEGQWPTYLALSCDAKRYLLGLSGKKNSIRCFSTDTHIELWRKEMPKAHYWGSWFFDEDRRIVTVGDKSMFLIDSNDGRTLEERDSLIAEYEWNGLRMMYVNVSPTGRYMVVWNRKESMGEAPIFPWLHRSPKMSVTVWDLINDKSVVEFEKPGAELNAAAFTQDEKYLVLSSSDDRIRLWSLAENKAVREVPCRTGFYLRTSEKFIVLGRIHWDGVIALSYPELLPVWRLAGVEEDSRPPVSIPLDLSKDGSYLTFMAGGRFSLYETQTWKEKWAIPLCKDEPRRK